jgi:diguanylate cyclase (GGDEF)-like protein/PAS domain S-box-containing protein
LRIRNELFKHKLIVLFGFIGFIELLEEIVPVLVSDDGIMEYIIEILLLLLAMGVVFWVLKGIDKTAEEFEKNKQKLKNIFDTLDVAIWSHDLKSNILLITPGIEKLYGYSFKEFYQDHSLWKKVIHPEDVQILSEREQKLLLGEAATSIYRIIRPDGEIRWIQDRGIPVLDQQGKLVDFSSVLFDITDRKESEDRYQSLVEMSPDIIAVYSRGKIDYINKAGCRLFGAAHPKEIIGQAISRFVPEEVLKQIKNVDLTIDDRIEDISRYEFEMIQLDGKSIEVEMSVMPIFYEGRIAKQVVGRDISQRKKSEKTIQYMAYYDALTGLPNRNMFRKHLNEVLEQRKDQKLAVLFLDLDRFKIINDTKGHTVGDLLLKKVANRLEKAVQNEGMVSRQGGDEFIILLEGIGRECVTVVAQRIIDEFSSPIIVESQEFYVTPSIGISSYPFDGNDVETLIKLADTAMYLAKDKGKNNFQFYSSHLHGLSSRKMELENGLRKAIELNQMLLYYQPQIELETEKIIGVEALIRWQLPEHGFISPAEFIPLAEETGQIVPLGKWILQTACKQNKIWQDEGWATIPIAVNISVRQIQEDHFVETVKEILSKVGLDPKYLELEITESIMQNIEKSTMVLNQLKELGVKISIDDFGTGYSSLSYLKHLPIDNIKIDKSFVDDIMYHSDQGTIVKTIIDMGNNLNFTVIAEGIETEEQVRFLKENACKIGQGYFYSRPLPAEQVEELF